MRLQVGMYVRTKDGIIAKCDEIIKNFDISFDREVFKVFDNDTPDVIEIPWIFKNEYIKKYSFDIIDLIEVGDYINGLPVTFVYIPDGVKASYFLLGTYQKHFINEDIKDIVTKEQFETCKYVVERDK